uniref:Uncharacterized protein n=1 Tax=Rhizophora mucronata TaxID=61149 RepID=A0A2P2NPX2_RHIMU
MLFPHRFFPLKNIVGIYHLDLMRGYSGRGGIVTNDSNPTFITIKTKRIGYPICNNIQGFLIVFVILME